MIDDVDDVIEAGSSGMEPVTAQTDLVTVEKTASLFEDDVFVVTFALRSTVEEPVSVVLTDHCPEENGPVEFDFHPDHDPEGWSVLDAGGVVYETELAPGEDAVTVYAFRVASKGYLGWLLEPPSVESHPVDGDTGTAPAASADGGTLTAADSIDDSRASAPTADGAGGEDRPAGESERGQEARGTEAPADTSPGGGTSPRESDVLPALLTELEARELAETEQALLRGKLGLDAPDSFAVRLRHVQERVDDIGAFRDALEAFIDENGEARDVLDRFERRFESLEGRIDGLEGATERQADQIERLSETVEIVDSLGDRLETVERALEALEEKHDAELADVEERVGAARSELVESHRALEDDLGRLREDVESGKQWRANLGEAIQVPTQGDT